jgi:hypothetical protein
MNVRRRNTFLIVLLVTIVAAILSAVVLQAQDVETAPDEREEMLRDSALHIVDEAFITGVSLYSTTTSPKITWFTRRSAISTEKPQRAS